MQRPRRQLAATVRLDSVSADDFDTVFYPGGHGPLWDLAEDATSIKLIETDGRSRASPSHWCAMRRGCCVTPPKADGTPVVAGRRVTGFTDSEEEAMGLTEVVPFLVEDELIAKGADFEAGDFESYVVTDGHLITGQNPASSGPAAVELISLVEKTEV